MAYLELEVKRLEGIVQQVTRWVKFLFKETI